MPPFGRFPYTVQSLICSLAASRSRARAYGCSWLRSTGGFLSRSKMAWASARAVLTSLRVKLHASANLRMKR